MPNKILPLKEGDQCPEIIFVTREGDAPVCGDKTGHWKKVSTDDVFRSKRIVLFALPGAYTPTCSSTHLPGYDAHYDILRAEGVDEVYCLAVNDASSCITGRSRFAWST